MEKAIIKKGNLLFRVAFLPYRNNQLLLFYNGLIQILTRNFRTYLSF